MTPRKKKQLHVTKVEVNWGGDTPDPPLSDRKIIIDGIPVAIEDVTVSVVMVSGAMTRITINEAPVMYPTEVWFKDVLRYRDSGWLSGPDREFMGGLV